jgi:hypothetical protein
VLVVVEPGTSERYQSYNKQRASVAIVSHQPLNLNILSAFHPLTPALSSSVHVPTSSIASRFSTTLRHVPVSLSGGKNGWSVPNNILDAPSFLPPSWVAAVPSRA